jgi:hypothetical protein
VSEKAKWVFIIFIFVAILGSAFYIITQYPHSVAIVTSTTVPPTAIPRATVVPNPTTVPPTAIPRATVVPNPTAVPPTAIPHATVVPNPTTAPSTAIPHATEMVVAVPFTVAAVVAHFPTYRQTLGKPTSGMETISLNPPDTSDALTIVTLGSDNLARLSIITLDFSEDDRQRHTAVILDFLATWAPEWTNADTQLAELRRKAADGPYPKGFAFRLERSQLLLMFVFDDSNGLGVNLSSLSSTTR